MDIDLFLLYYYFFICFILLVSTIVSFFAFSLSPKAKNAVCLGKIISIEPNWDSSVPSNDFSVTIEFSFNDILYTQNFIFPLTTISAYKIGSSIPLYFIKQNPLHARIDTSKTKTNSFKKYFHLLFLTLFITFIYCFPIFYGIFVMYSVSFS